MSTDFNLAKYPKHLQELCRCPGPKWLYTDEQSDTYEPDIDLCSVYSLTKADVPNLLDIAEFIAREDDLPSECHHGPANAWQALGQLGSSDLLPKMMEIVKGINWSDYEFGYVFIFEAIAKLGVDRLPELIRWFQDKTLLSDVRATLSDAFVNIQEDHPEHRELLIRTLVDELSKEEIGQRQFYGLLVSDLVYMNARETLPLIEKMYAQGYIDPSCSDFLHTIQERLGGNIAQSQETDKLEQDLQAVNDIIHAFNFCDRKFPKEEVLQARQLRDVIVPSLIEELRDGIAYARQQVVFDSSACLFAVHLFAEFQAKEALPVVLESLSLSDDEAWSLYIDSLYETIPGILYRLIGSDFEFYDTKLRSPETPEVMRRCLLGSLPYLVKNKALTKESYAAAIRDYFRQAIHEANEGFATDILDRLFDINDPSDLTMIEEAFENELIDREFISCQEAMKILSSGESRFEESIERATESDYSDTIAAMSSWAWFKPEQQPALSPRAIFPLPRPAFPLEFGNGSRLPKAEKIGRNDPCPCGSGKKYKKCCLKR